MAKKPVAKGTVVVTPEVSLNVDLDANNLVDIHVALKEEELLQREKQLEGDLKRAEEALDKRTMAVNAALKKIGEDKAKEMTTKVFPALKAFGFKALDGECKARIDKNDRGKNPKLNLDFSVVTGKGHNAHGIYTNKRAPLPAKLAKMERSVEEAQKGVQEIRDEILKVKQGLAGVDRMERKARAQMAIRALESTSAGRKMLAGIKADAKKALPAPR